MKLAMTFKGFTFFYQYLKGSIHVELNPIWKMFTMNIVLMGVSLAVAHWIFIHCIWVIM